ncbi:MAG: Dockerin type domain, partial [Planctomycetota bacterium]
ANFRCEACTGDLNSDGTRDAGDLALLLGGWGAGEGAGDVNGDGSSDATDLGILLGSWGPCP